MIYLVWFGDRLIAVKGNECDAQGVIDRFKADNGDYESLYFEEVEIGWEEE